MLTVPEPQTYDEAVHLGEQLVKSRDDKQFELGYLALRTPTKYGTQTRKKLAQDIGVAFGSLNKYAGVADCFDPHTVATYPHLSYSYFEVAAPVFRENPEQALSFLEDAERIKASGEKLSVEEFAGIVNPSMSDINRFTLPAAPYLIYQMNDGSSIIGVRVSPATADEWRDKTKGFINRDMVTTFRPDKS